MGSTLGTIRALLDDQLDFGTSTTATNPTSTVLNKYINNSIRKITRELRPRELYSSSATTADIVANTNSVSIPTTMFIPDKLYYKEQSGTRFEVIQMPLSQIITSITPNLFFDTSYTGRPSYYDVQGTSFVFSKHFDRSESGAIEIIGVLTPTELSDDSDTTELPADYDLLIVYESAILFYQKDDDQQSLNNYITLAMQERNNLRLNLQTNRAQRITLDPYRFLDNNYYDISNPNVFFT